MTSLFESMGGDSTINSAVELFYNRVLADDRINHFFALSDMDQLKRHQRQFLKYAFGGQRYYPGPTVQMAHRRLVDDMGLDDVHFDAVIHHLGLTLAELEIDPELINQAAAIAESVRNDVLGRPVS